MSSQLTVVYQQLEDGWIQAQVPELPGAVSQGRNLQEAREMIQEAVELLLETYRSRIVRPEVAEAVWHAATDTTGQLRFPAGGGLSRRRRGKDPEEEQ